MAANVPRPNSIETIRKRVCDNCKQDVYRYVDDDGKPIIAGWYSLRGSGIHLAHVDCLTAENCLEALDSFEFETQKCGYPAAIVGVVRARLDELLAANQATAPAVRGTGRRLDLEDID